LDSLIHQGRQAANVVLGTVPLFLIAAVIEGFFRQLMLDNGIRLTVAAGTAVLWVVYFTPLLGRWQVVRPPDHRGHLE
jgi:hypothetical protein